MFYSFFYIDRMADESSMDLTTTESTDSNGIVNTSSNVYLLIFLKIHLNYFNTDSVVSTEEILQRVDGPHQTSTPSLGIIFNTF